MEISDLLGGVPSTVVILSFSTGYGSSFAAPGALVVCSHRGKQAVNVENQDLNPVKFQAG